MSLLKKQNKFEESIKAKLSELETKPSDSLWAKLEKELDTDSFEPALRQKFDDFEVPVSEKNWTSIEAQLPQEKSKKRILVFWFTGIFVSALSLGILISRFYFPSIPNSEEMSLQSIPKESSPIQSQAKVENQVSTQIKSSARVGSSVEDNNHTESRVLSQEAESENQEDQVAVLSSAKRDNLISESVATSKAKSFHGSASSQTGNSTVLPINNKAVTGEHSNSKVERPETPSSNQSSNSISPLNPENTAQKETTQLNNEEGNTAKKGTESRQLTEAKAPVQLDDLQIKFDKDSVVRGLEVNAENYTSEEDKLGKFSITAVVGVYRTEMLLSKPGNSIYDLDKAFDLRSKLERASIDWSGGFLLNYNIHPKWMISSGVQISNFKQALHYDLADPVSDTFNQLQSPNLYLHPSDSIIEGHAKTLVNKFSFTEIPIWISYSIHTDRAIGFDLMLGYSFAFLTSVNAYMPDPACVGLLNVNDKNSFPFLKGSSFINFAPAVNYKINQSVQLGVMPQFKLGLSSVIDNKNWIQEKPIAVGLNFYLRKRF